MTEETIHRAVDAVRERQNQRTLNATDMVRSVMLSLPADIPHPELSWDPDGAVELEWYWGCGRVVSLSVYESGQCYFSGVIEGSKDDECGSFEFSGNVPEPLVRMIRRGVELGTVRT